MNYSLERIQVPFARAALFIIYAWFGALKVVGQSPANPLVADLLHSTLPFLTFDTFIFWFGLAEVILGILFLFPRIDRLSSILFWLHMIATTMPLIVLPATSWSGFLVPTLEGQYIIKNLALMGLVITIGANRRVYSK